MEGCENTQNILVWVLLLQVLLRSHVVKASQVSNPQVDILLISVRAPLTVDCEVKCMCHSDLCVPHAGGCYKSLLQNFVLQSMVLLSLRTPFELQQVLNNL